MRAGLNSTLPLNDLERLIHTAADWLTSGAHWRRKNSCQRLRRAVDQSYGIRILLSAPIAVRHTRT